MIDIIYSIIYSIVSVIIIIDLLDELLRGWIDWKGILLYVFTIILTISTIWVILK